MIAVVGGSGLLGRHVVADLRGRGEAVRVVVRDADNARALLPADVEVLTADVRRSAELVTAVTGASVVVSAMHGFLGGRGAGPTDVDLRGNKRLIDAAMTTGAAVVLVSVVGAAPDSPLELSRAKFAAEHYLRASGAPFTIVRASAFLETWLRVLAETAGKSGRPLVLGRGEQPISFVSAVDVAEVVGLSATDQSLRGRVVEVTGAPVTMRELATALQAARGWEGDLRWVPRPVLRILAAVTRPLSPAFARKSSAAVALDVSGLGGRPDLTGLLGRPPRNVDDVLGALDRG